jgi:hypothetical protein
VTFSQFNAVTLARFITGGHNERRSGAAWQAGRTAALDRHRGVADRPDRAAHRAARVRRGVRQRLHRAGQIVVHARSGTVTQQQAAVNQATANVSKLPDVIKAVSPFARRCSAWASPELEGSSEPAEPGPEPAGPLR